MAGRIPMGQKELPRSKMLEMVKQGKTTLKAATVTMRVSYLQGIRLYKAYLEKGDAALIHGNAGMRTPRLKASTLRIFFAMSMRRLSAATTWSALRNGCSKS